MVCRFKFSKDINREIIESQLALAIVYAECNFGQPKVRTGAAYCYSKKKSQVVIDVSTDVGEHIARVFTGLLIRQLGENKFTVDRVKE